MEKLVKMAVYLALGGWLAADAVLRFAPMAPAETPWPWVAGLLYLAHRVNALLGGVELIAAAGCLWALIDQIAVLPHPPSRPVHHPL